MEMAMATRRSRKAPVRVAIEEAVVIALLSWPRLHYSSLEYCSPARHVL
jgi:hypothetical protein